MSNLLTETKQTIKEGGYAPTDIIFIGSATSGHSCTWKEFEKLANFEYDEGFGGQEVASDLIIAFSDGARLWRDEYDGAEDWHLIAPFKLPTELKPITTLCNGDIWATLEEMNQEATK